MRRIPKLSFAQGQLMLWILIGSLIAFGAMFVFVRFSGVTLGTNSSEVPRILWMPTARQDPLSSHDTRYVIADVFDPSLMSLPSAHGFSRAVWAKKIEATQRNLGWNEQPAFLRATTPETPQSLLEPVPVDTAVLVAAEKTPALSEESSDNEVPDLPMLVNQSVFRVLSALEDRRVVYSPPLPIINSPTPLNPTQVRVGVGSDGSVLYALLDRSCGDEAADAQALALTQLIRFEPGRDSSTTSLSWGVVRFLWATQPLVATNTENASTSH